MKRLAILLMCICLLFSFTFSAFAATSCDEWCADFKQNNSHEQLKQKYNKGGEIFDIEEAYSAYHIKDDAFFKKLLMGAKIPSFISEKCDIGIFFKYTAEELEFNDDPYVSFRIYRDSNEEICDFYNTKITHEQFSNFITDVDNSIKDGKFGDVKNVSFLFYDLDNVRFGKKTIPEDSVIDMYIWFVYVESNEGEFLVPYVLNQWGGNEFLENGKIYTLKDCAKIMKENVYVYQDNATEKVNVIYPWQIAIIAVAGAAALAGAFFGMKKITKRKGDKSQK